MSFSKLKSLCQNLSLVMMTAAVLSACDASHTGAIENASTSSHTQQDGQDPVIHTARSLDDIAAKATMPEDKPLASKKVSAAHLQYTGRYHTRISCQDAFADCESGEAEYILTLLEDGSAFWNVIHFGRVRTNDGKKIAVIGEKCPQLEWQVNPAEHTLNVRCPRAGVNFYYQIDAQKNLVVDLERLTYGDQGKTREFLEHYYFIPKQAYVLKKE